MSEEKKPRKTGRRRANGDGSIYRRADGMYVGAVYVPQPDGTTKRQYVYGKVRADVKEKVTELLRAVSLGLPAATSKHTVGTYLVYWRDHVAKQRVRPSTLRGYDTYIRCHLVPDLGTRKLDKLTAVHIRVFLNGLRDVGLSARTIQQIHAVLRAALQQAVREDLLARNVAKLVQVATPPHVEVKPWTAAEARTFLKRAESERLYAVYAVAIGLGLRRGEILGLHWADVDLEGRTLYVRTALQRVNGKLDFVAPKTARSRRRVPLPKLVVDALTAHRQAQAEERRAALAKPVVRKAGKEPKPAWTDTGLVFTTTTGTALEPRNVNRDFTRLCTHAKVRLVRFHDMRHTCASLLLGKGVAPRVVMDLLGHSQIGITMNIYAHVMPESRHQAADALHDALNDTGDDPDDGAAGALVPAN